MAEIDVKNVKFGDCSIIKHNDSFCIVDCGSSNKNGNLNTHAFPYSMVENELCSRYFTNKCLLVSHFDSDHISGISLMKGKIFDSVYFPTCIIDGESKFGKPISRLLSFASKRSRGFTLGKCIIDFLTNLENIVKNNSGLIPLKSGDKFSLGGYGHTILWPETERRSYPTLESDIFTDILKDDYDELLNELIKNHGDFMMTRSVISLFEDAIDYYIYHLALKQENSSYDDPSLDKNDVRKYYSAIREQHSSLGDKLSDSSFIKQSNLLKFKESPLELLKASYRIVLDANNMLWGEIDTNSGLALQIKSISRQQYHHFIKTMNALSVIFHENNAQYVFLGDAPSKIIERVARKNDKFTFFNRYKVVKVQHHGTQTYFTEELPKADNYIISNGGYKDRPVGIDTLSLIRQRALNDPNVQIFCTNSHLAPDFYCSNNCCYDFCNRIKTSYTIKL